MATLAGAADQDATQSARAAGVFIDICRSTMAQMICIRFKSPIEDRTLRAGGEPKPMIQVADPTLGGKRDAAPIRGAMTDLLPGLRLFSKRKPKSTLKKSLIITGVAADASGTRERTRTYRNRSALVVDRPTGVMSDLKQPLDGSRSLRPLVGLQVLRAIAALAVVINHAVSEAGNRGFIKTDIDVDFGGFGVDVFFVISGFIMIYSNVGSFGRRSSVASFLTRRIIRIVPLYWIISTLFLVTLKIVAEDPGLSLPYVLSSYLLIPYPEPQDGADFPFYFLAWTLEFEMFFYLCFSISLIWRRSVGVLGLCSFMVAYLILGSVWTFPAPLDYWVSSQLLEFVAGCLMAEIYLRGRRLSALTCLSLTVVAVPAVLVTWYFLGGWPEFRGLVWGLPATALVAAATLRPSRATGRLEALLTPIGDASYSLYLVHSLVFIVVYYTLRHAFRHWNSLPPVLYVGLLLLVTIVTAFISYSFVERPLTAALLRRISRYPSRA